MALEGSRSTTACVMQSSADNVTGVSPSLCTSRIICLMYLMRMNCLWNFRKLISIFLLKRENRHLQGQKTGRLRKDILLKSTQCLDLRDLQHTICAIWIHVTEKHWSARKLTSTGRM